MATKKTTPKNNGSAFFGGQNNSGNKKKPRFSLGYIYLIVAAALIAYWAFNAGIPASKIDNTQFNKMVIAKDIEKLEYVKKSDLVNIYLKEDAIKAKSEYEQFRNQHFPFP